MNRLACRATGAAVLVAASCFLPSGPAADPPKPVLPDAEYAPLVEQSAKLIAEALAGSPNRRLADKARVTAVMLAEFAQQNLAGAEGAQRATVRDAALAIAGLIGDKKFAEAAKEAARLPRLPAKADAKKERVKLMGRHVDVEELMSQFRATKIGGLGIETRLDELAGSKGEQLPAAAMNEDLRLLAYRTAIAAELTQAHVPDKTPKDWQMFAEQMRKSASELAEAVKTKDGKAAYAAMGRLNMSCNKCHLMFR